MGLGDNRTAAIVRRIALEERAHVAVGKRTASSGLAPRLRRATAVFPCHSFAGTAASSYTACRAGWAWGHGLCAPQPRPHHAPLSLQA